ncbi:hypothetical protein [Clostridium perfringens]|nr:hypothetical protein [Clostridium perfringens]
MLKEFEQLLKELKDDNKKTIENLEGLRKDTTELKDKAREIEELLQI